LVCVLLSAGWQSDTGLKSESQGDQRAKGEYIVEISDHDGAAERIRSALKDYGVETVSALETNRPLYVVELASDPGPGAVEERVQSVEGIVSVQPNYKYSTGAGTGGTGGSADHADPGSE